MLGDVSHCRAGVVTGEDPGQLVRLLDATAEAVDGAETVDAVRIRVTDDGPGVSPALVPTLFEPFTRRHDGDVPGLGLALAVGSRLAIGFGATLSYGPAIPRGACFEVRVPIEAP